MEQNQRFTEMMKQMLKTTEVILQGLKGNNAPATIIQPEAHLMIGSPNPKQVLEQRENTFQTRCLVDGKLLSVVIDGESCTNLVSEYSVKKLGLNKLQNPKPYNLQWLNQDGSIEVTKQAILKFEIGRYKDEVLCDVVPMEEAHVLIGKPWQFDRNGQQDEVTKKYKWSHRGQKFVLKPLSPKEIYEDQLQMQQNLKKEKEKEFQAKVEEEVKEDVEEKEEVLVDELTTVTCEEHSQALISSQEEPKFEVEEKVEEEAEEVKGDILVDFPDLSAPEVYQFDEEPEFDRGDEYLEIMEHLPIVPAYAHVDFVIGDTISEEEARMDNRREVLSYIESFPRDGVPTIRDRIVFKKGEIIRSSPRQFRWKSKKNDDDHGSRFYKDSRSNLLQERGNDVISTSAIFNSRSKIEDSDSTI
ncbi:unnamed protein product [Linum trigynum]|uniref:Uncharacterized protein n=1 Tax=Linum trigynum TaxID=586398 RepID=A0AAV2EQA6_9ROSI